MKNAILRLTAGSIILLGLGCARATKPAMDYPLTAVPFMAVRVSDGFWKPRIETNRTATIPHCLEQCEKTGRISNFAKAGGLMEGKFEGIYFNDSDLYKVLEGASYALAVHRDPEFEKYVDGVIAKIAAAQEDDGYLYTARTLQSADYKPPGGKERWSNISGGHELYCVGHMYAAAVAHYRATGKRTFLDVAIKNADLICDVFGPGKKTSPPGHQQIEIGLADLYRVTSDEKYLRTSKFFLDTRGREDGRRLYGSYSQDHKPVVDQTEAVGHAVRAAYMYSGMADVAALTGETVYVDAIDRIWEDVVKKKIYLTGGLGAAGGHEGFGPGYDLPNLVAYCETCAAFANVFWNHRMFLHHGDAKYIDILERTLYNGAISGISLDGKEFFYPNPLESDGRHGRSPWFGCACCPSNVARFVIPIPGYAYAHRKGEVYVNLFIGGETKIDMAGRRVTIVQETRYPWDGAVKMTITPERRRQRMTLNVRIPGWARNEAFPSDLYRFLDTCGEQAAIEINGRSVAYETVNGYASIRRTWKRGDVVELQLPMPVRRVASHEKLEENAGKAALQRGPIVYCLEWPDVKDGHLVNLLVPEDAPITAEYRSDLLEGVEVLRGKAQSMRWGEGGNLVTESKVDFTAIPYYAWAHRGRGEMAVWLAHAESAVRPLAAPTIASTSKAKASGGNARALNDQREPKSSGDHSNLFLHWWPLKGTKEWVQYDFKEPATVSSVEVYWFDDTGRGACRLPVSWQLFYRDGEEWKPVRNPSGYGCEGDKYNKTTFEPVKTDGLRIEVQLPEKFAAGIHEWRVK